jgi:hypothetical protein
LGGELFDTPTDPLQYLLALTSILTPACTWRVGETKKEERRSEWDGRKYTAHIVYVGLDYKSVEGSPLLNRRFLKKTILSFLFDGGTACTSGAAGSEMALPFFLLTYSCFLFVILNL